MLLEGILIPSFGLVSFNLVHISQDNINRKGVHANIDVYNITD